MDKEKNLSKEQENEEIDSNLEAVKEEMEEGTKNENLNENDEKEGNELEEKYEKLNEEVNVLNDRYLRLQADFSNYKRRIEKEKESLYKFATEEMIKDLLSVIDNFERAFASINEEEKNKGVYEGMEMVYNQFLNTLKKSGLEEIEALGKKFDHNLHDAVMQEDSEDHEEGTIIEVFQKGYKLKDKVIRPSMVKVSN